MTFQDLKLNPAILKALTKQNYTTPTPIQQQAIPVVLGGRDLFGCAQTGTGKTAAFALPIVQLLSEQPRKSAGRKPIRSLILTPTRELALQILENIQAYAGFTDLRSLAIVGGVSQKGQERALERGTDILIATPGRLIDLMNQKLVDLQQVQILVLDEADRMLDMGFVGEMNRIILEAKRRRQTMLFSATLDGNGVNKFSERALREPVLVEATPPRREKAKILQWMHAADDADHKLALLIHILKQEDVSKVIVFVKTRERLATLTGQLEAAGLKCCWLQGEMAQDKRQTALARFSNNQVRILVATDIAARGLDIDDITHVINYDMPRTADVYVHRIGRTGRAGKKGTAISLVEAHDIGVVGKVERYTEQPLKRRFIEGMRPKHKEAKAPTKQKKPKTAAKKKALKKAAKAKG